MIRLTAAVVALAQALAANPASADDAGRRADLYKTPGCGCCDGYAEHLRANGFEVTVREAPDLAALTTAAGIPAPLQSCHMAMIDGYAVSGHVPIAQIERLLAERPALRGISLPGMPVGTPGMPGPKTETWTTFAIGEDGAPTVFAVE
jgi:hypothetical protein